MVLDDITNSYDGSVKQGIVGQIFCKREKGCTDESLPVCLSTRMVD